MRAKKLVDEEVSLIPELSGTLIAVTLEHFHTWGLVPSSGDFFLPPRISAFRRRVPRPTWTSDTLTVRLCVHYAENLW